MKTYKSTSKSGISLTLTEGKIFVDRIEKSQYDDDKRETALLKMNVTTVAHLPAKQVGNELQSNIFSPSEFGYETEDRTSESTRTAFLPVPIGTTKEQLQTLLDTKFSSARIYRILSSEPVLTKGQKWSIESDTTKTTLEDIADTQKTIDPTTGELIEFMGRPVYRVTYFDPTGEQTDKDFRIQTPAVTATLGAIEDSILLAEMPATSLDS